MAGCCPNPACVVLMALGIPMAALLVLAFFTMMCLMVRDVEDTIACWFRRRAHARDLAEYR